MLTSKENSSFLTRIKETNVKKLVKKKLFNSTTIIFLVVSLIFLLVSIHFWIYYIRQKKTIFSIANTKRCRKIKTSEDEKHSSSLQGYWFKIK